MDSAFNKWAETAAIGEQYVYGPREMVVAWWLSGFGEVMLFQRARGEHPYREFEYVAQRISPRARNFIAVVSKSIQTPHNPLLAADFSED